MELQPLLETRRDGSSEAPSLRDRCLWAVARAMPFLVAITATNLGAVQSNVVRGLAIMAKPNLPKGGTFHTKMADLRASRAGPRSTGGGGRLEPNTDCAAACPWLRQVVQEGGPTGLRPVG